MIFSALSGSSGQVPVTPIGGNQMYYALACIYCASQANSSSLKKAPQLHVHSVWHPRVPQLVQFFCTYPEALCSLQNACYSHRAQHIQFPPMGVTGTWPEHPERALNIICISLKFLHILAQKPCILANLPPLAHYLFYELIMVNLPLSQSRDPAPYNHAKKGSGNIVYNELSQQNSITAYVTCWNVINIYVKFAQETIDGFIHSSSWRGNNAKQSDFPQPVGKLINTSLPPMKA